MRCNVMRSSESRRKKVRCPLPDGTRCTHDDDRRTDYLLYVTRGKTFFFFILSSYFFFFFFCPFHTRISRYVTVVGEGRGARGRDFEAPVPEEDPVPGSLGNMTTGSRFERSYRRPSLITIAQPTNTKSRDRHTRVRAVTRAVYRRTTARRLVRPARTEHTFLGSSRTSPTTTIGPRVVVVVGCDRDDGKKNVGRRKSNST